MVQSEDICDQIASAVRANDCPVFLVEDFERLGDRGEILAALRSLERDLVVMEVGLGIYGRMTYSEMTGTTWLEWPLSTIAMEYAARMGATVVPLQEEYDNLTGASTQVPVGNVVAVDRELPVDRLYVGEGRDRCYVNFRVEPEGRARLESLGAPYLYKRVAEFYR